MRAFGPTIDLIPLDITEKGINIAPGIRPIVQVVGVLVQIHHQQGYTPGQAVRMIPRPIVMHRVIT